MTAEQWVVTGGALAAISGVPAVLLPRRSALGEWIASLVLVTGCGCGFVAALVAFGSVANPLSLFEFSVGARFTLAVDAISAVFLFPVCLVSLLGAVYGLAYWKQADHPENGRKLRLFYGLLAGSLMFLVTARSGLFFLAAWEGMALSAFFLVATDDHDAPTREAGWLYLATSHFATLCLFVLFALMHGVSHEFGWATLGDASPGMATVIFVVALLGFGTKAGLMPMHFWLPSAHAMAPSHVSALMSGVMIKTGIYGLVRVTAELPHPPAWWGGLLVALGVVSGVLGVAFAIGQHDIKRLLAYHSIENIGIIAIGLGVALLGRSLGQSEWVMLGMAGALLHTWNHALFKSLLFLSAGSVIHAVHTREIDALGGLAKAMPGTAFCFLIGAVAICGLPPLNGFVSELFIYLGLFQTLGLGPGAAAWPAAAFAAPALALMGALAAACFVKVFGVVFLGAARSAHGRSAHESSPLMVGSMGVLAAGCGLIGLAPAWVSPVIEQGVVEWGVGDADAERSLAALAPLSWISTIGLALLAGITACSAWAWWRLRAAPAGVTVTWDCGYAAPLPTMQYTSSSFAQMLVGVFGWALRPKVHRSDPTEQAAGRAFQFGWSQLRQARRTKNGALFPAAAAFQSEVRDTVLIGIVYPCFHYLGHCLAWMRVLQQGSMHLYLLYIFVILIVLLLWR